MGLHRNQMQEEEGEITNGKNTNRELLYYPVVGSTVGLFTRGRTFSLKSSGVITYDPVADSCASFEKQYRISEMRQGGDWVI